MCLKCRTIEVVLALVIILLALWPDMLGVLTTKWVTVIAAFLLLVHAFGCKKCNARTEKPARRRK